MSEHDPEKLKAKLFAFAKDFALFAVSLFSTVITVVLGSTLLQKELGKRTILNLLSKPVARWEFIVGKFLGLFLTLTVIVWVMSLLAISALWAFEGRPDWNLLLAAAAASMPGGTTIAVSAADGRSASEPTLIAFKPASIARDIADDRFQTFSIPSSRICLSATASAAISVWAGVYGVSLSAADLRYFFTSK